MRTKIINSFARATKHFLKPLVEGEFKVVPPPPVPKHIVKPQYATSPNPVFGLY